MNGHSSHHPRAMEVYRGRLILYGCGDLINDYEGIPGYEEFRGDLVLMYLPTLDRRSGELLALELLPFRLRRFQLREPSAVDRAWLRRRLGLECARFGLRVVERAERLAMEW